MNEIDPIAAAGTVIGAFVAGSGMFYALGRHTEENRWKPQIGRDRERLQEQLASIKTLNNALDSAHTRIKALENNRVPPPPPEQANQLVQTLLRDENDVWLASGAQKPLGHDSRIANLTTKIISVVNLKGGVGKTTTTANLAAYFDTELSKRVLVIDADYQGSLTAIFKRLAETSDAPASTAQWLEAGPNVEALAAAANPAGGTLKRTRFLSAFYELSNVETRLMVQWLLAQMLKDREQPDLRYALARILHSPSVLNRFDIVLIDCPPRLSTATVNALCASTHFLIPTVPDNSSLEAAANFIKMARSVTSQLNHNIRLLGIAPTLTQNAELNEDESNLLDKFKNRVRPFAEDPYIMKRNIPRNKPIASLAGTGIALLRAPTGTKKIFKAFGAEIVGRLEQVSVAPLAVAAE